MGVGVLETMPVRSGGNNREEYPGCLRVQPE